MGYHSYNEDLPSMKVYPSYKYFTKVAFPLARIASSESLKKKNPGLYMRKGCFFYLYTNSCGLLVGR
jgi:hypothetical protein